MKIEFIVIKEGLIQSIISDLNTFGMIFGSFYLNYIFMDNNQWLSGLLIIMFVLFVIGKGIDKNKFYNEEDAIKYLEGLK